MMENFNCLLLDHETEKLATVNLNSAAQVQGPRPGSLSNNSNNCPA